MKRRQRGFTLLEVLVTLVAFGLLMVGLMQGGRFGLAAWRAQDSGAWRNADLEAADRILRLLITEAHPGTKDDPPAFVGLPGGIVLRTALPQMADGASARGVDAALGIEAGRALVLRWSPHGAGGARVTQDTLLAGLDHIEFAYWRAPSRSAPGGWQREWREAKLPALVKVRLEFPARDRRHWPDIVASPMRDRPIDP
jgi:general secretion pathway protein J